MVLGKLDPHSAKCNQTPYCTSVTKASNQTKNLNVNSRTILPEASMGKAVLATEMHELGDRARLPKHEEQRQIHTDEKFCVENSKKSRALEGWEETFANYTSDTQNSKEF